jgi:hypothetical protein
MDSTISVQPAEAPDSLHRARRAAWGSFAGAVVDWYDFLLYGITAALVFNREFFPQIGPAMGTLAAFATFGVGFLFRPLGGIIFGHFGDRLGRKRMLMMTVWMMGIATACIGLLPRSARSAGGRRCCWCSCGRFRVCRRRRMGRRGAALGGERPAGKKPLQQRGAGGLRRRPAALHRAGIADQQPDHRRAVPQLGLALTVPVQRGAGPYCAVDP